MIVLSGLIVAVFLILSLTVITVVCFRRHSRRNQKYRSVSRDPPGDLPLKAFPDVGGPTQTYHTGCDLGLSTSGSVCMCRELSGGLGGGADTASINSSCRPRSSCRGCDVTMTSHKPAESEYHRRCPAEVGQWWILIVYPLNVANFSTDSGLNSDHFSLKQLKVKGVFCSSWEPISELRGVTCHVRSQNVTCHSTQVNVPRLNPGQTGGYFVYLPRRDGRLSWPR